MIRLETKMLPLKRLLSPGQTRVLIRAVDAEDKPVALFLCGVEPPNSFERRMRESFHTICSVEDLAEYPVGVSSIREIDPASVEEGVFLYSAQENIVYVRSVQRGLAVWIPFRPKPENLKPNVHSHKLPFFRRSAIDIILPNREFVSRAIGWIEEAVKRLEKDMHDLEMSFV
jgi:hypothetical protein